MQQLQVLIRNIFNLRKSDVDNCFYCPTSTLCSACEKGYKLVGSFCQAEEPQPLKQPTSHITSQPTQTPFSSSSTALSPTQIPTE
ncbi:hypothetical protein M9Y10_037025 [Tritrichomonas musculus]|uniref:Uncharacterized protein n=1 Tax=Tritrichomonas musculus TaxID=1915356 RepID=A0ABR2GSU1_9EUKA